MYVVCILNIYKMYTYVSIVHQNPDFSFVKIPIFFSQPMAVSVCVLFVVLVLFRVNVTIQTEI